MSAVIVALLAIVVLLLASVGVAVVRLLTSVRRLTAMVQATRVRLQPTIADLAEGTQLIRLESEQLQRSIAALNTSRAASGASGRHLGQVSDVESTEVRR